MKTFVLLLALLTVCKAHAASPLRRDSAGVTYMAAVEMKDATGREVLITGMGHLAPQKFYDSAQSVISNWAGSNKNDLVVLREFPTCTTSVLDNGSPIAQAAIDDLVQSPLFATPVVLLNAKDADVIPVITALNLNSAACRLDIDKKTMRPPYVVDRNEAWCKEAHSRGVACQFDRFNVFLGEQFHSVDADLKVDGFPLGFQAAATTLYRSGLLGLDSWKLERLKATTQKFLQPGYYLLINGRNQLLLSQIKDAFTPTVKRVVLPWGAEHTVGLVEAMQAQGFRVTGVKDVRFGGPDDLGKWDLVDQTLKGPASSTGYGFTILP